MPTPSDPAQDISDTEDMEDLALSPMASDHPSPRTKADDDNDIESGSRLIPLSMSDGSFGSSSDARPLPSLNAPITFRDVQFVGVYVFHVLLMLLATGYIRMDFKEPPGNASVSVGVDGGGGGGGGDAHTTTSHDDSEETVAEMNASAIGVQLRSLCVVNVLFCFGWLLFYLYNDKMRYIQVSCAFSAVGLGFLAVALFSIADSTTAMLLGVGATATVIFDVFWISKYKNALDFVAVLFELIVHFLVKHPSLAIVTVGTLVCYTVWASWICTSLGYVGNGASPWQFSMLFLYLHFYWTSNIVKNILTVVVSGATMIWYYKDDSSDLSPQTMSEHESPVEGEDGESSSSSSSREASGGLFGGLWKNTVERRVVLHYLRGALSSSFGSICIGSLLCPLAHVIWNVLRWARRDESVLSKRIVYLRSAAAENFIRTYHKYSFVHVAGYGKPFYVAARDSWNLIEKRGVEAIVDDDLTSRLLLLSANGWASVMCALCVPAFSHTKHTVFFALASFILCYTTLSIATQIMGAVIKTLFVCFAENPGRLNQLHPLIYHRFARLAEVESFRHHKAPPARSSKRIDV